jgi:citrate lyase synthetase
LHPKYDLYLFPSCSNEVLHILFRIDIKLFEKMVQVDIPLSSRFVDTNKECRRVHVFSARAGNKQYSWKWS